MTEPGRSSRPTAADGSKLRGRAPRRPPPRYRAGVARLALLVAAVLLGFLRGGAAAAPAQTVFELGRIGGNIAPFTVQIRADGSVRHSGPVRLAHRDVRLSQKRLAALRAYARSQGFWSLRRLTLCRGQLPDFASLYVAIHTGGSARRVTVRGDCSPRFSRIYRALAAAATVTS